LCQHDPKVL